MSWPKPSDFTTLERRKKRQKLQRWTKAEAAQMRADRLDREFGEWLKKLPIDSDVALRSIMVAIDGEEFAAWYESKTGRDAGPFVGGLREAIQLTASQGKDKALILDTLRAVIARIDAIEVVDREWLRSVWSDELREAKGPKRRRLLMRLATPAWANPSAMFELYAMRDELTAATGIPHHVDHIVPIQHPLVCGLNCEANLRVITATENLSKRNHFVVGGRVDG